MRKKRSYKSYVMLAVLALSTTACDLFPSEEEKLSKRFCGQLESAFLEKDKIETASPEQINQISNSIESAINNIPPNAPATFKTALQIYSNLIKARKLSLDIPQLKQKAAQASEWDSSAQISSAKNSLEMFVELNKIQKEIKTQSIQLTKEKITENKTYFEKTCPGLALTANKEKAKTDKEAANSPATYPNQTNALLAPIPSQEGSPLQHSNILKPSSSVTPNNQATDEPHRELETGAIGAFKVNHLVYQCHGNFSTKVSRSTLFSKTRKKPGTQSSETITYLSVILKATNVSQHDKQLCDMYSGNLVKTKFRLFVDGVKYDNIYPIFKWPTLTKIGETIDLRLLFAVPRTFQQMKIVGHFNDDLIATLSYQGTDNTVVAPVPKSLETGGVITQSSLWTQDRVLKKVGIDHWEQPPEEYLCEPGGTKPKGYLQAYNWNTNVRYLLFDSIEATRTYLDWEKYITTSANTQPVTCSSSGYKEYKGSPATASEQSDLVHLQEGLSYTSADSLKPHNTWFRICGNLVIMSFGTSPVYQCPLP
jgi:hypothetical protein